MPTLKMRWTPPSISRVGSFLLSGNGCPPFVEGPNPVLLLIGCGSEGSDLARPQTRPLQTGPSEYKECRPRIAVPPFAETVTEVVVERRDYSQCAFCFLPRGPVGSMGYSIT